MSLTSCIKKAGKALNAQDKAAILTAARKYRTDGVGTDEAALQAVDDQLATVRAMLAKAQDVKPAELTPQEQAQADLKAALGDLGDILGKNTRLNMMPEQEAKLLPVLTKLLDAAFRLGYIKFKDAAKFALDQIRAALGNDAADSLTLDHLQGAYISLGKREGTDSKRAVIDVEDKSEIENHTARADNVDKEPANAASTDVGVERDSQEPAAEPAVGDAVSPDAADAGPAADEAGGRARREDGRRQPDATGVPFGSTAPAGIRGNQPVHTGNPEPELEGILTGSGFDQGGFDFGSQGVSPDAIADGEVEAAVTLGLDDAKLRQAQRAAERIAVKPGDLQNVRDTLPYLLPNQQEDVHTAETRFAKPTGYGMLFTNGTGTGKTFSGLGIVKRFAMQGKNNVLIVVPDEKIGNDWIESGRALNLTVTRLADTRDAGKGIVLTTYANLGENDALASRDWDLVVPDEAHSLMQAADGEPTTYLENLRAITRHPQGAFQRYVMQNRPEIDRTKFLSSEIQANEKTMSMDGTTDAHRAKLREQNARHEAEIRPLIIKLAAKQDAVRADVKAKQGAARTRLAALSATPFAYEKTIDWANGYLFDYRDGYPYEENSTVYNQPSPREYYFQTRFGYTMRFNKLTQPDAKVDRGLMQRQWNSELKKSGALSGRMLDVKPDYDRRFVLVDSAIGHKIDEALEWLNEQRRQAPKGDRSAANLADDIAAGFKYLQKRYILEAIKAREVIPIVRQHMALGRKVVVFHDYKKGGVERSPFDIKDRSTNPLASNASKDEAENHALVLAENKAYNAVNATFRAKFPELITELADMESPIEVFTRELPETMLVNGDQKKADLLRRYKEFQDDARGPRVMLVQSAKNKGWSGHDTTGKNQRVLINLGQPTAPTLAIQQEGRIYRTGQASDAIMRYLNTGTDWERWTFASTIATRASAAENLGMGEMARALKDSFIQAFEESDAFPPGHEGEGKGGKERDQAANNALSEYDRAKTFYFGQQKKNSRTKAQEGKDYFATPEPVGVKMVEWLDLKTGEDALEPSAGHGAIARWLPGDVRKTLIEPSPALRSRLAMVTDGETAAIIDSEFEDHHVSNKYDGIVMNPPFGSGGKTAVDHIAKAATHLRDGGRIVAILPTGPAADKQFDKWFYEKAEKPLKPLTIHPKFGNIYKGDTVVSRSGFIPGADTGVIIDSIREGMLQTKVTQFGRSYLTSVTPESITSVSGTGKRTETIRPAADLHLIADLKMPAVMFERAGTAVATRIIVIEKQTDASKAPAANLHSRDLTGIDSTKELFDRMEYMAMPPRLHAKPVTPPEPVKAEKPVKAAKEVKPAAEIGATVTIMGKPYTVTTYTTNGGKELRGVWVPTKAIALSHGPSTFEKKGLGFFVRERDFPKPEAGEPMFARVDATDNQDNNASDGRETDTRAEATRNIGVLDRSIASHLDGTSTGTTIHPYDARILPGDSALREIAQVFGSTLQGFGLRRGLLAADEQKYGFFNGVRVGGIVFVAARGNSRPHLAILGHELAHEMATKKPELYAQLVDAIRPYVKQDRYKNDFLKSEIAKNSKSAREEFIGEILSDGFMDREFWRSLGNKNPGLLKQIGGLVMDLVEKILKTVGYVKRTEQYLTDYKQVMKIAGEAMAEFGVASQGIGDLAFSRDVGSESMTDSAAFKKWFGDSKVVDNNGKPLVVYHGTVADITEFKKTRTGEFGPAIYTTSDPNEAAGYAQGAGSRYLSQSPQNIMPVYVSLKNPFTLGVTVFWTRYNKGDGDAAAVQRAINDGFDGVIEDRVDYMGKKSFTHYIAFSPEQIKSVTGNNGNFDAGNADIRFARRDDLGSAIPDVIIANPLGIAKTDTDYAAAKAGDVEAAVRLAKQLVTPGLLNKIGALVGQDKPFVVGVAAIEASGENQLPGAAASIIARHLALPLSADIVQSNSPKRTAMNGLDRIFTAPEFDGNVESGKSYILVDDTVTQGATFAALASHIKSNGGTVRAVVALTGKNYSATIQPSQDNLSKLRDKYGDLESTFKATTGYGFDGLTNSEARYLAAFEPSQSVRDRILQAAQPAGTGQNGQAAGLTVQPPLIPPAATPPQPPHIQTPLGLTGGSGGNNASWDAPEKTSLDDKIYLLQDKHIDTKRVLEKIRAAGNAVSDKYDVRLQEELYHSRTSKRTEDFVNTELNPLLTQMAMADLKIEQLDEYLHARHAEEANQLIADRNPGIQDGGSGMTTADAQAYLAGLDPAMKRRLESAAARVDAILAKTRDLYASYGLESRDTVNGWASMFKHYVPLMREDHDSAMGIGQGFSIKGKEVRHRTGSTAKVIDILANIALQREKAIVRGEKNRVATALMGLAKMNPNPEFWTFDKAPTEQVFNPKTGLVETRTNPMFRSLPNVVVAKIKDSRGNVHERAVVFNEHNERAVRMAQAMKNLDATALEGLWGLSARITRYFAAINTQYNPIFGLVNLVRDAQTAAINLNGTALANRKADVLSRVPSALAGVYRDARAERHGAPATSPWAAEWEEFQDQGGSTGFRDAYRTSADRADAIRDALDPTRWMDSQAGKVFTAGGALRVPMEVAQLKAKWLFDWLSDFNTAMENAVRVSTYQVGKEQGLTRQRAASLAKNLTVNFNRKGQIGSQAGAVYAFFNASMQGTARMAETMLTMDDGDIKTVRLSKVGKAVVAGGITLGAMQAIMLAAAGFGDDEPPEFVRERNLILPIGGKQYLTLPMPLGFHVIPNIGRLAAEFAMKGFKDPAKYVTAVVAMMTDAFSPVGGSGSILQTLSPTPLDPISALSENKDWTGKPIYRNAMDKAMPGHAMGKDTASIFSRWLSEVINEVSGGTEYSAGKFSPTPDQIDYLIGQVTGGTGRELSKAEQAITASFTGEDLPPHKIPLVGRFYGNAEAQSAQANTFYENVNRLAVVEREYKGRARDGKPVDAYTRENPEVELIGVANRAERAITALRRIKTQQLAANAPRAEVKETEDRMAIIMKGLNDKVLESREKAVQ